MFKEKINSGTVIKQQLNNPKKPVQSGREAIFFFRIEAKPLAEASLPMDIGGAVIASWIRAHNLKEAEQIVRREIKNDGWRILEIKERYEMRKEDMPKEYPGREFWEQAKTEGFVINFHTYPVKGLG